MFILCVIILSIVAGLCRPMPLVSNEIFTNCSNSYTGTVLRVELDNCTSTPCALYKNTTANITVWFQSNIDIDDLRLNVYGWKSYIKFPFVQQQDVCNGEYNMECPISATDVQKFEMQVEILDYYPSWKLTVVSELYDASSNEDIVCIKIKVKIQ